MKKSYLVILFIALLSSCATPYQKHGVRGGYSEVKLSDKSFAISFRGNGFSDSLDVDNFVLYRSAELTQANGFKYFRVMEKDSSSYNAQPQVAGPAGLIAQLFLHSVEFPMSSAKIVCYVDKKDAGDDARDAEEILRTTKLGIFD